MTQFVPALRREGTRSAASAAAFGAAVVVGSLVVGWWYLNAPLGGALPYAATAVVVLTLLARWNFGAVVAVLVLAVLNGLPGPDLENFSTPGNFRISDVAVFTLVALLFHRQVAGAAAPGTWLRRLRGWAFALGAWWLITLVRSSLEGIPPLKAFLFGRDFLYFALLLPLVVGALRSRREIHACLAVLAGAAVLHALGQIAGSGFGSTSSLVGYLVHSTLVNQTNGITRFYSYMADAVSAAMPLGLGLAIFAPSRRLRLLGISLTGVASISVLFQLTRATYLGLAFALVVVVATWMVGNPAASARVRRASAVGVAVTAGLILALGYRPLAPTPSKSAVGTFSQRAVSGFTELQQRTGTIGYRYNLEHEMLRILGNDWVVGLGFWHPDAHYVASLPDGSIRNSDTGVLNSVMTMGLVGTGLLYFPVVALLLGMTRRRRDASVRRDYWFYFGASAWLLYALVSSVSLVTLFSPSGLALTATILGCGARLLDWADGHGVP